MSGKKKQAGGAEKSSYVPVNLTWRDALIDALETGAAVLPTMALLLCMQSYEKCGKGVIENCRGMSPSWWATRWGIPREDQVEALQHDCIFWQWHGNDLHLAFYNPKYDYRAKGRDGGKQKAANARARAKAEAEAAKVQPQPVEQTSTPAGPASPVAAQDEQAEPWTEEDAESFIADLRKELAQTPQGPAAQDEQTSTPAAQLDAQQEPSQTAAADAPADFTQKGDTE